MARCYVHSLPRLDSSTVWLPRNEAQRSKHFAQGCQTAPVPLADAAALDCSAGAARSAAPLLARFVRRSSLRRFIAASMLSPHESSTSATACAANVLKHCVSVKAPVGQRHPRHKHIAYVPLRPCGSRNLHNYLQLLQNKS